ncbi:M48 family metallopeptidase [Bdellovibrio sp. HCB209]|uniref:M48 family metallopeptidase n=1 Tax=Bdellovibrio sp. HCB209 TaxID=3394354 RepID=UPI0039B371AD
MNFQNITDTLASHPHYKGYFKNTQVKCHVVDMSRPNAYASFEIEVLLFKKRFIVIYDELIHLLTSEELKAVIAHELEHHRNGDYNRSSKADLFAVILMVILIFCFLVCAKLFPQSISISFLSAATIGAISLKAIWSLCSSYYKRQAEYRADRAASIVVGSEAIISALTKIDSNESSVNYFADHPLTSDRLKRLRT